MKDQGRLKLRNPLAVVALAAAFPVLGGARGDGCGGTVNSRSPAPDVNGVWSIQYDDTFDVEITLGGAVHHHTIGSRGGAVTIEHDGRPLTFDLDCERPEVVCPSEVWPRTVTLSQRNAEFPHRMFATLPFQTCEGRLVEPAPADCGPDTLNADCQDVCDGDVTVKNAERFGVIDEAGRSFELLLGAGVASNGINCALLGASVARADLITTGDPEDGTWRARAMDGEVVTAYAGGCLWAGDPDDDGTLEAIVIGASIKLTTGFDGSRQ